MLLHLSIFCACLLIPATAWSFFLVLVAIVVGLSAISEVKLVLLCACVIFMSLILGFHYFPCWLVMRSQLHAYSAAILLHFHDFSCHCYHPFQAWPEVGLPEVHYSILCISSYTIVLSLLYVFSIYIYVDLL